jgi:pyruvate ferredoxin oxidoreductase delta subunit
MVKVTLGAINYIPGSSKEYKTGSWRSMRPIIDLDKCKKCWTCYIMCPDASIIKCEEGAQVNYDYCKGCGICASECKFKAIIMQEEVK